MALSKKPVTIYDVQRAIGEASSDLRTLCVSDKVNLFSYYKPVDSDSDHDPDTDWPASVKQNLGINIPAITLPVNTSLNWTRDKPGGGALSPYRLHDFGGYEHAARPCLTSGCTGTVTVNMGDPGYTSRTFTFEQIAASSRTNVSALNLTGIKDYYFGFIMLTSLTATEGALRTCDKTIGAGGNSLTVDFLDLNAGTQHTYLLFVLSNKKSTGVAPDVWDGGDPEVKPLAIYHDSTYLNPVPLNIVHQILMSATMTGVGVNGALYDYNPFSNFTASPLTVYLDTVWVKVRITNLAAHQINYTTLFDVEVVSFWGTTEHGTPGVLDATTGASVSGIFLSAGESKDYILEIPQFCWHNGEAQDTNFPSTSVTTHINLSFGELLAASGDFLIKKN